MADRLISIIEEVQYYIEEVMTGSFRPPPYVVGPDGSPLTIAGLPAPGTRWVARRKAEVVVAVEGGLLSLEEACRRYSLTIEEYLSWQISIDERGLAGLRTTHIHIREIGHRIGRRRIQCP